MNFLVVVLAKMSPKAKEDVMGWYCLATFTTSALLFGLKQLLLRDSANSRISKAAEYVKPVEVRELCFPTNDGIELLPT